MQILHQQDPGIFFYIPQRKTTQLKQAVVLYIFFPLLKEGLCPLSKSDNAAIMQKHEFEFAMV